MNVSTRSIAIAAIAVTAVALVSIYAVSTRQGSDKFAACRASTVAGGAGTIGGPFTLTDENGKRVTDKDVLNQPSIVYFGYTFCPDICPTDNARNAEAIDLLSQQGYDVGMALISVDPERDDPERLRDFTDYLHPEAMGYTGSMEQIQAAAQAYKAYFKKEDDPDPDFYLVDHSTFTYLMLPGTGFADFFKRDVTPADMAERTSCFVEAAAK